MAIVEVVVVLAQVAVQHQVGDQLVLHALAALVAHLIVQAIVVRPVEVVLDVNLVQLIVDQVAVIVAMAVVQILVAVHALVAVVIHAQVAAMVHVPEVALTLVKDLATDAVIHVADPVNHNAHHATDAVHAEVAIIPVV